ncbi:DUF2000 domain-containing protein [Arenibaculum pallidiluteum]|uniref:DUF2000 domain-containing protein n=1 Tax=Arenibaculum pallidiluteum TaxID=2812559 RepID=UPI001A96F599|nr:DUF2000 domain-containing protein [Arenibaculum pallidiluteum]
MTRTAFVIDRSLPPGLIANTAAILAMSLGRARPELVGPDVLDGDGLRHPGITTVVLPILAADAEGLRDLRARAERQEPAGLYLVDVTETAQRAKTYQDYTADIADIRRDGLRYLGLGLHGPAALVRSLTGHLPLMR